MLYITVFISKVSDFYGLVVSVGGSHAEDPGSIPGNKIFSFFNICKYIFMWIRLSIP